MALINYLKDNKNIAGFTLVEMMIGITIFSIILSAVAGLFATSLKAQRSSLASQELLSQTSYVLEYTSRALRMAKKDLSASCLTTRGNNYENTGGDTSKIRFIKFDYSQIPNQDVCYEFSLVGNSLQERKISLQTGSEISRQPLTSPNLQINNLKFILIGETQNDNLQPRVVISLSLTGRQNSQLQIQTTVSQRNLDINR